MYLAVHKSQTSATFLLLRLLMLLLFAQKAAGAVIAQESSELSTVLVSPRRIPGLYVDASEYPGNASVITAQRILSSGVGSIPELLNQLEGVTTMDTNGFGLGADGSVNLRGIVNSSRTNALVLLNGVRQNRLTGDEVHWQMIPIEQVERIEIIRGGGALIYGEGALAGVINIITKKAGESLLETEHGLEFGSFGQQKYFVSARGQEGQLSYGTSYQRRDVSGYRESTNSRTTTVTAHLGLDLSPQLHIETNVLHSEDVSYFAGGITSAASQARRRQRGSFSGFFDDSTTQTSLDLLWTGPHGASLMANAFCKLRESDSVTSSRFATISPSKGLSIRGAQEMFKEDFQHTIVAGIDLLDEKASTGTRGAGFAESNKESYGLYAEETIRLMDRLSIVGGLRFDNARFEEDISFPAFVGTLRFEGWSPRVGLSLDLLESLNLYANYARPFKSPNVDDFAAAVPTGFVGNIDLDPQQANDYEVGLRWKDRRFGELKAAWFYNRIDDEILFNDLPGNDQNQNFDTRRTGIELSAKPSLPLSHLTSRLAYTFIDSEFRKGAFAGNTIPATPEHQVSASLTYEPVPGLFLSLDWLIVQDFFRINDFSNVLSADNYGVLNIGIRAVRNPVTAYLRVENVTNEEYTSFQSSNGIIASTGENPQPPISLRGGITLKF